MAGVNMDIEHTVKQIAELIQTSANVRAVFGEPMAIADRTVIPVAKITVSITGGGSPGRDAGSGVPTGTGEAGRKSDRGVQVQTTPAGFIYEKQGELVYQPIELPPEGILGELSTLASHPLVKGIVSLFTPAAPKPQPKEAPAEITDEASKRGDPEVS